MQRDVFGRLLYASLQQNVDIEKALSYPLSPVPFSLCHSDGIICKTPKSVILDEILKHQTDISDPPLPDISIFDGFYLLHILKSLPESYGKISKHILRYILYNRKEVYIIFDKYNTPSIKDYEHSLRGADDMQYNIQREGRRTADFSQLLRSRNFKEKFVEFLIEDWSNDEHVILCEGKTVKLDYDKCYVFQVSDNKMQKKIDWNSSCYHEEADTKIIHHICQINYARRVRIHCTDSDIPVIMLANMNYLKSEVEIIVDMSTSKKPFFLNINEIHRNLGDEFCRSLAVCHIFTGNDYNPSFFNKGKKRPLAIFNKDTKFQEAFNKLITTSPSNLKTDSQEFEAIEEYVCRIYSLKTKNDVNKGRFEIFEKKLKKKNENEEILKSNIKGYDAATLPPTKQTLLQQIKRTIYISSIWCNAHLRSPTNLMPENCGWAIIENEYVHYWYDGPECPTFEEISVGAYQ